ncbi:MULTISPECIES: sensor domain-containing diguanylate cyclase [Cyanophyceae]|uniref:sensor domain-containing diguanylate cyclase n=1 Tax=Cyanophyceae TaxID=3028117 RepID=UPI0016841885|nr:MULTISPECIES: sensor domain-containing diguanylate cyclase [Cyanophyceae]MBD1917190.1 sensor domain-containing diguanylate cyclase [Phormidium sp. FACHB-77]MBD2030721.1 sensor domain-containing diguanylate cyclase [Phormidium sp. FACHB-322]MBD2050171.1 sensor domain-containing diguanylate cyclase [Leptolyngbya sp. FACHB-60]
MTFIPTIDASQLLDFNTAALAVLTHLHDRLGFDLWMVTRTEGEDWIVLQANDAGYGVKSGDVFRWSDSFCSRMIKGEGPRIAPSSEAVVAYAEAPIGQQVKIGAYVGVPLLKEDGTLFGTLCAIDPLPQPHAIQQELPLIELLAQLLSRILHADIKSAKQARLAEHLQTEALTDGLTGLYNRRGWDQLLDSEEERCAIYGYPASIIVIDIDDLETVNDSQGHAAGDQILQRTGHLLKQITRKQDTVARIGSDEFAMLCVECPLVEGELIKYHLMKALSESQIHASVGIAGRHPSQGLRWAWANADRAMYSHKHASQQKNR